MRSGLMLLGSMSAILLVTVGISACSGPFVGGGIGGAMLLTAIVVLLTLGGSTGCESCGAVGPCLDIEPDYPLDAGQEADVGEDAEAGDTDQDQSDADDAGASRGDDPGGRDEILARMRDRLPEDVADRLDS